MNKAFIDRLYQAHNDCGQCPRTDEIVDFFNKLLGLLFPNFANEPIQDKEKLKRGFDRLKLDFARLLDGQSNLNREEVIGHFFDYIPEMYEGLRLDVDAIFMGDPAAKSHEEIVRSYPGFYAIAAYRVAHRLLSMGVDIIPRTISEHAHSKTGIDIHPRASIGERFCIDHGTGIVIGETTVIGDRVKVYQGVTLGALSVSKMEANVKRHPTIEDDVVIYSGATILGGDTVIGAGSIIGGNVWLTRSVPPMSKAYYQTKVVTDGQEDLVTIKSSH